MRYSRNTLFYAFVLIIASVISLPAGASARQPEVKPYLFMLPILDGQMENFRAFVEELAGDRAAEWKEARRTLGLVRERGWVQRSPQGTFLIIYQESVDPEALIGKLLQSQKAIDRYFVRKVKEIHGVDLTKSQPEPNTLLWSFASGETRHPGVAFAIPILDGQMDAHRQFIAALNGEKKQSAQASRKRWGLTREMFWEQKAGQGSVVLVYHESPDLDAIGGVVLSTNDPFDLWLFQEIYKIYGVDVNGYEPIPQNMQVFDWTYRED